MRMVQPCLKVVKQPPSSVLVGSSFEIEVLSSTPVGNDYQLTVDDRVNMAEASKPAKPGTPATLRCSCSKSMSDVAILIRLVCKRGKVVATAKTSPVSITHQKIDVATTKEWTSLWYKDEGGREKSIDLVASLQACEKAVGGLELSLKPVLYYAPGSKGMVMVANQDILRILSEDLSLSDDGTRLIRFRIEDVSKNHQGQDFLIQLSVAGHPEIAPGLSPSITVRSKRNKRFRASTNAGKPQSTTKKAANGTLADSQLQKALRSVMKWSEDVALILQVTPPDSRVAKCLAQYGYIREQLGLLHSSSTGESSGPTHDLQHRASLPLQSQNPFATSDRFLHQPYTAPMIKRPEHGQEQSTQFQADEPPDAITNHVGDMATDFQSNSGANEGVAACAKSDSFLLGLVKRNGYLEEDYDDDDKVKPYQMFDGHKLSEVLSVRKYERPFHAAWKGTFTKSIAATDRTPSKANDRNSNEVSAETEVEYLLGVTMKSKETDECLGFPVFSSQKHLLGFVRRRRLGLYRFMLPPASFTPSDKEEASRVFDTYRQEAIFSKTKLQTIEAMAHHALVYQWKDQLS